MVTAKWVKKNAKLAGVLFGARSGLDVVGRSGCSRGAGRGHERSEPVRDGR